MSSINPTIKKQFNRTFARRIGKRLSDAKKNLLSNILPKLEYSHAKLLASHQEKKYLEIGFGMGEHLFHQTSCNPDNLYIGAEVYLNGVANFLKLAKDLDNFLIWPNDLDMMLEDIPDNSLNGIYVLFPDPWHKRRYMKKRLLNIERLNILKSKLKIGGFIAFASDIEDYFQDVQKLFIDDTLLAIGNNDCLIPHDNYIVTKYHLKALTEGRVAKFIQAIKIAAD